MFEKYIISFIILYLLFGIGYQMYSCLYVFPQASADGISPDIPCAGIPWTPIILIGWPLFGVFNIIYGFYVNGIITLLFFGLVILIPILLYRRSKIEKPPK